MRVGFTPPTRQHILGHCVLSVVWIVSEINMGDLRSSVNYKQEYRRLRRLTSNIERNIISVRVLANVNTPTQHSNHVCFILLTGFTPLIISSYN